MKHSVFLLTAFILVLVCMFACKSPPQIAQEFEIVTAEIEVSEVQAEKIEIAEIEAAEIEVIEPEFDVVSISILQADIVVTEFEAILKVTNPNDFAIELSSITYQLFGNSEFWAEGAGNDVLHIPAKSSGETSFVFKKNFINMSRKLLDDVISMRQINYRFRGQAQMQPDIPDVSAFLVNYNCSGFSEVRRRTR